MKKALLIIAMAFISAMASAQTPISFEYVIQKEGATAEQIYSSLVDWIATNFKAVDGEFYHDKEEKVITKDIVMNYESPKLRTICYNGDIRFKLKFQCRDGRFKMILTNFNHQNNPGNYAGCVLGLITDEEPSDKFAKDIWEDVKSKIEEKSLNYKNEFETLQIGTSNDDW